MHGQPVLNLPYTGANLPFYEPSKIEMKMAAQYYGVQVPAWVHIESAEDMEAGLAEVLAPPSMGGLGFPLIVKHPSGYGSVGMTKDSKVTNEQQLREQVSLLVQQFGGALIEEFISGREFTVLCAFGPGEDFKHFDLKWNDYESLSWRPCDFRVDGATGEIHLLEINPNCGVLYPPGLHGSADYIMSLDPAHDHLAFIRTIVAAALERHRLKQRKAGEVVQRNEQRKHVLASRGFVQRCWPEGCRQREWFDGYAYPLNDDVWVTWSDDPGDWLPLNHSCDPNTWLQGLDAVARRDIAPGKRLRGGEEAGGGQAATGSALAQDDARPMRFTYDTSTSVPSNHSHIGLFPRGTSAAEENELDRHGAQFTSAVFIHRFNSVMGNVSLRADLYRAIDLVMTSVDLLPRTFRGVPGSSDLLAGHGGGSAAERTVLNLTLSLYANASGRFPLEAAGVRNMLAALGQSLAELSVGSCHSYLRRLVLATLLRFSPDTDVLLFRIYRILYAKYRQGAAAKGAIEFLHISKSGGTSMCTVADANGCSAESTSNFGNCMVRRFDDRPRWVSATAHNETAPLDGWRWYYRYLFLNVILLRHPLSRLVSHIKWIMKVYRTEYGKLHEDFFRGRDAAWWRRFAPAAVDNYNMRLLLGEGAYYAPIGSLTAAHLAAARLVLLAYDVVLMLEAPDVDELWLKQALGWRVGLRSASARVAGAHRATAEMMPPDLDTLIKANENDVLLYNFAYAVHQIDGVMFAAMAAAGIRPYHAYDSLDPQDQWVGRRVKCGFVTRRQQFLIAMNEDPKSYERSYNGSFPRVLSPDERRHPTAGVLLPIIALVLIVIVVATAVRGAGHGGAHLARDLVCPLDQEHHRDAERQHDEPPRGPSRRGLTLAAKPSGFSAALALA
eukprot:XP_001702320.1 predicted protein [Chlamydomonas reinhardtii]